MASKLVDKLKQLSRGATSTMGFRPASGLPQSPQILLIAGLTEVSAEAAKTLIGSGIDAGLLHGGSFETKSLKKLVSAFGDIPLGVTLSEGSSESIAKIVDSGCDFVVFSPRAPAGILDAEGIGKILEVKPNLEPGLARAIDDLALSVDGVLIAEDEEKPYLTIEQLLVCQRFAALLDKPLLMPLSSSVSAEQIHSLWRVGVDGVVIFAERFEVFSELRKAVSNLPRRAKPRATKTAAVLPRVVGEIGSEAGEEEEEE